jgi:hypothetical protein
MNGMSPLEGAEYFEIIDNAAQQPRRELRDSILGNQETLEELAEVWEECRTPGWDGYNAVAVDQDTLRAAYTLVDSLPFRFPRPSIGADPDGQLTLEWRKSPTRVLSVSVDPDGLLHFAGLFGADKQYGTVAFYSSVPDSLLQLVRSL